METNTASADVMKAVKSRSLEEIKALGNEHKIVFNQMPFLLEGLSPQASKLLDKMVEYQKNMNLMNVNRESVFISHAERMLDSLKHQRHILHLRQLVNERERQNERDKREMERFERELKRMKEESSEKPSIESMQKEITATAGRVANYEKTINDSKIKEEKLSLKPEIMPESLEALIQELDSLQTERDKLKVAADHITIARDSKRELMKLKNAANHM